MSSCTHETFRFTFASEGDESVVGATCCDCGELFNTATFKWPAELCVTRCAACMRPIEVCCHDTCPNRDAENPARMVAGWVEPR